MSFMFIIYAPIFLLVLYLVVGISIDIIAWLIGAIRQRRMARLLANCKKQWLGRERSAASPPQPSVPIAANTLENGQGGQGQAADSAAAAPVDDGWNGEERRDKARRLRPFRDYAELDKALDAVLQAEQKEARYKLDHCDIWHAIGWVQQRAVNDVRRLIASIPRDTAHGVWQEALCLQLVKLADRYRQDPPDDDDWRIDDQLSFYGPTVWEFIRAITLN